MMRQEDKEYQRHLSEKERQFDQICIRCGRCCGSMDDPCRNLEYAGGGRYRCRDYANRLGPQLTVSGKFFTCIMIRDRISFQSLPEGCAYGKKS